MYKTIPEILKIEKFCEFEDACEEYRDVLLVEPSVITFDEIVLLNRISVDFSYPRMRMLCLCWLLEPVFGVVEEYEILITTICINLCVFDTGTVEYGDMSYLQYAVLELIESYLQNISETKDSIFW
jgi:hypothetical protein